MDLWWGRAGGRRGVRCHSAGDRWGGRGQGMVIGLGRGGWVDKGDSDVCGCHRSRFSLSGRFLRFLRPGSDVTGVRFSNIFSHCTCAVQSSDHFRRAKPRPQREWDPRFFFQAKCV